MNIKEEFERIYEILKLKINTYPKPYVIGASVLVVVLIICLFTCKGSCESSIADAVKADRARVGRPEKAHRLRYVKYKREFNDLNDKHLSVAKKIGIKPLETREALADVKDKLVKIDDNRAYEVDKLTHSVPYLVPEAASLLQEIGESFRDSLVMHHYSPYKIIVTSVLRTDEDVKKLSKRNVNASKRSVHCYGTTFDITYKRFHRMDNSEPETSQAKLQAVLGEVLSDLKKQGRCYVKFEVKQACFHVTVRE